MKKLISFTLAALIMLMSLTACGDKSSGNSNDMAKETGEFKFEEALTIVVPFSAGGAGDIAIRTLQPYLEKQLGVSVVIDNPDGAAGTIGTSQYVSDGANPYSVLLMAPTSIIFRPLTNGTDYSYEEDFVAVSQVTSAPLCLMIKDDAPIQDAAKLLEDMKANPNKYSYANSGIGSISDIAAIRLLKAAGIEAKAVPFSGTAEQYTAIMGNHVDLASANISEALSKEGMSAIINLGTNTGAEVLKDIPTCADLGYEVTPTDTTFGLIYHKDVAPAVVEALDKAVCAAMEDPECIAAFEAANILTHYRNSADFDESIRANIADTRENLDQLGMLAG